VLPRRWVVRICAICAVPLVLLYAALAVAVRHGSAVVHLDTVVLRQQPWLRWPEFDLPAQLLVLLGQRAIVLAIALVWLGVRALRTRDLRPLVLLGVATLLVNVTVGTVKLAFERLGPLQLGAAALDPGGSTVFSGGTIFPSGHAANAVVTWGVLAVVATRWRALAGVLAGLLAGAVGVTTLYLGTHWVSDVVAGWAAGGLVLLALPVLEPLVQRLDLLAHRGLHGLADGWRALTRARRRLAPRTLPAGR
jgi:undecaprenyl-diphosphatase